MSALKWLLMLVGAGLFGSAGALVAYDVYLSEQLRRLLSRNKTEESGAGVGALARRPLRPVRWRLALQLAVARALVLLLTEGFVGPMDGRNLFANDVMRSAFSGVTGSKDSGSADDNSDDQAPKSTATAAAQRKQPRRP